MVCSTPGVKQAPTGFWKVYWDTASPLGSPTVSSHLPTTTAGLRGTAERSRPASYHVYYLTLSRKHVPAPARDHVWFSTEASFFLILAKVHSFIRYRKQVTRSPGISFRPITNYGRYLVYWLAGADVTKYQRQGGKQEIRIFSQFRRLQSEVKVLAWLVPFRALRGKGLFLASVPDVQMAVVSLCLHIVFLLCVSLPKFLFLGGPVLSN